MPKKADNYALFGHFWNLPKSTSSSTLIMTKFQKEARNGAGEKCMIIKQLNQKRTLIAIILCVAIFFSLIAPSLSNVFGASYNVVQSRRIADIDEFPESYRDGLRYVQKIYPNAKFILYDTGLDWHKDLLTKDNQLRVGVNLIGSHVDSFWKSKDPAVYNAATNTYAEIEPGWNQVSSEGIQYYMDPRNFFNEKDIFMFLNLEYDGTQTVEGTAAVIANSFMKGNIKDNEGNEISYAEALHKIGQESGVSPYLLACRIRQEQGSGRSAMISGHYGNYPGYYNHFNIGAYGSTTSTILNRGLSYAKSQGWNTPYKSILGGAKVLAESYVKSGKNTLYLQHFNMVANKSGTVSYSVYMANIQAPYSENRMMISSFTDKNTPYTFVIPVYKNMPKAPVKPPQHNIAEDCNIKSIKITENCNFTDFDKYSYNYDVKLDSFANTIKLQVELEAKENELIINNTVVPKEDGKSVVDYEVKLMPGFNTITFVCKSETGMSRTYTFNVINDDGKTHFKSTVYNLNQNAEYFIPNAPCTVESLKQSINVLNGTVLVIDKDNKNKDNDMLCFASDTLLIRSNDGKIVYKKPIVIYGDVNCDGLLNDIDVNAIKEHILEIGTLFKDELKYADVNKDGLVTVEDIGALENIIKTTTNDASDSVVFTPSIVKDEANPNNYKLTLSIPDVPCITEGFLVYDEGNVATINATNSGRIHFITDGTNVMFENGFDELVLSPVLESENVNFQVEILSSYHYMLKKDIEIEAEEFNLIQPVLDAEGNEVLPNETEKPAVPEGAHVHRYTYRNNNDATLTNSATQSGTCVDCGKLNTKILHGTRMELVEKIEITISQARLGKGGLPTIGTVAPPVKKVSPVWRDQNGSLELTKSEDIVINVGDTYQLGKIILTPTSQCVFDEDTKLYINGKLFSGEPSLFGNRIVFSNLGEFKF